MKKLMFAAAALVAGFAMADIQSSNIVGYQQYSLQQGYNLYAPVFEAVSGTMDLQDLKLNDVTTGSGANLICLLDENGIATGTIGWWLPDDGTGEESGCWFDGDAWEKVSGVTISEGQGFYVYAEDSGISITAAGAVKLTAYAKDLVKGYNLVGNCSPVDLDLQSIKLDNVVTGSGANLICLLDNDGIATGTIGWWLPDDGTGEESGCWFDGDAWEVISGVTIRAGEGLYVNAEDEGVAITLPCAIAK